MPWPKGKPTEHLRIWTGEQEKAVIEQYDGNGSSLANVLPFSASAIRNKAKRLGVQNNAHHHHVIPTRLPKISKDDWNYIAGFVDGEGSITYSSTSSTRTQYRIQIANSDEMVIRWIHSKLEIGKVRINKPRKQQHLHSFILNIERQGDVWGFLVAIMPYLRVKKLKAEIVLKELINRFKISR